MRVDPRRIVPLSLGPLSNPADPGLPGTSPYRKILHIARRIAFNRGLRGNQIFYGNFQQGELQKKSKDTAGSLHGGVKRV
jgi:hypothetical protein